MAVELGENPALELKVIRHDLYGEADIGHGTRNRRTGYQVLPGALNCPSVHHSLLFEIAERIADIVERATYILTRRLDENDPESAEGEGQGNPPTLIPYSDDGGIAYWLYASVWQLCSPLAWSLRRHETSISMRQWSLGPQ